MAVHGIRALPLHLGFTLAVAVLSCGHVQAQPQQAEAPTANPDVERLTRGIDELRKAGNYAEALPLAQEALSITLDKDGRDSLAAARVLTLVADIYVQLQNYAEAEPLYRRALEIDKAAGADIGEIVGDRNKLKLVAQLQKPTPPTQRRNATRRAFHIEQASPKDDLKTETKPPAASQEAAADWDLVPIFYGTDRDHQPNPKRIEYNDQRAHRLELGRALVTVPKNHKVPNIERPWALHIPYFDVTLYEQAEDPKEHFTLREIKSLSKSGFLALVRERLAASTHFQDHAFVFVHGYNTSFDNALYRTAQIANDMHFDGAPFVYSWPSGGAVASYGWDRESAEGARRYLREFLDIVVKETGAKSISIVAHSMGNIALLDVLRDMNKAKPANVVISQIILAAPDVSMEDFTDVAEGIKGLSNGVTLYASSNDRALQISRGVWGSYRAGDVPPSGPLVAAGVDTIDVTAASTDVFSLNHSDYAQNSDLVSDIGALVDQGRHPPDARSDKLHPAMTAKGGYWRYLP
jgi:esterase/lipase superfamily enzyme